MTAEPPSRQYRRGDAFNGLEPAAAPLPCACTHALGDARMIEVLDLLMGSTSSSGDGGTHPPCHRVAAAERSTDPWSADRGV